MKAEKNTAVTVGAATAVLITNIAIRGSQLHYSSIREKYQENSQEFCHHRGTIPILPKTKRSYI